MKNVVPAFVKTTKRKSVVTMAPASCGISRKAWQEVEGTLDSSGLRTHKECEDYNPIRRIAEILPPQWKAGPRGLIGNCRRRQRQPSYRMPKTEKELKRQLLYLGTWNISLYVTVGVIWCVLCIRSD